MLPQNTRHDTQPTPLFFIDFTEMVAYYLDTFLI